MPSAKRTEPQERPIVDTNQATSSACLDEQQFVGNVLSRLSVPKVIETRSRHTRQVLTSGINGMTPTQNLL